MSAKPPHVPDAGNPPDRLAWIGSGLVVDAVLGMTVTLLAPQQQPYNLVCFAVMLCWSHGAILPRLVWLGRRPDLRAYGAVAAGLLAATVSVGIGFVLGLVVGFFTIFAAAIPGFFVGGLIAGVMTTKAMAMFGPVRYPPPVWRAAAAAGIGALVLITGGFYLGDTGPNAFGTLLLFLLSGIIASALTVPGGLTRSGQDP